MVHSPLLGYANNYDFIKISSTVGLWVLEPGVDPLAAHPDAPLSHYRFHGPKPERYRYLSSELLLIYPALVAADLLNVIRGAARGTIDLRMVGFIKMMLFLAAAIFLAVLFFRRSPWLGLSSAAIFALIVCDPFNTLYFNTLYFDDSALLFTWLAIGCAVLLLGENGGPRWLLPLYCLFLVLAGLSKMQHPGLPLAIVIAYAIALPVVRRRTAALWFPAAAAVLALILGAANNQANSMEAMQHAAATDLWFGTVLPALERPAAALRSLGLPERCDAYVGKTWYDSGMQPGPCPEIFRLGRLKAGWLLLKEPAALSKVLVKAALLSRPRLEPYGQIEGRSNAAIGSLEQWRFFTLTSWTREMPSAPFAALLVMALVTGALSMVLLLLGRAVPASGLCLLLNAVLASTFLASLLGDGYQDLPRHMHLGVSAFFLLPAASIAVLVQLGRRRRVPRAVAP